MSSKHVLLNYLPGPSPMPGTVARMFLIATASPVYSSPQVTGSTHFVMT